jgi:hypothetical protein
MSQRLEDVIAELRSLGIRSIELEPSGNEGESQPQALPNGSDGLETMPAEAPEQKADGSCCQPGCTKRSGFYYAPQFCEAHGLRAFGVGVGGTQ